MAEIFDEINESLRRDRWHALWKKYSKVTIAALTLMGIGLGAYYFYTTAQQKERLRQAQQFQSALDQENAGQANAAIAALNDLASHSTDGYAILARFRAGALMVQEGRQDQAVSLYQALAQNQDIDPLYRDLAKIFSIIHRDTSGQHDALIAELSPLADDRAPFRYFVREIIAGLALAAGDTEQARQILQKIVDDVEASDSYKSRAVEILRALETTAS